MSETLETVTKKKPEPTAEQAAAEELVRRAREQGLSLTGPDGLLKQLTKVVIETALAQELTEHLGPEKNAPSGNETGNVRNGSRLKKVLTEGTGQAGIEVPRDRAGTFEPQIVKKRQRRLNGVDEIVLSLYAKGLTTGEISAHFAEIYGASVSKETISRITDRVIEEMQAWQARPLDEASSSERMLLHAALRRAMWVRLLVAGADAEHVPRARSTSGKSGSAAKPSGMIRRAGDASGHCQYRVQPDGGEAGI